MYIGFNIVGHSCYQTRYCFGSDNTYYQEAESKQFSKCLQLPDNSEPRVMPLFFSKAGTALNGPKFVSASNSSARLMSTALSVLWSMEVRESARRHSDNHVVGTVQTRRTAQSLLRREPWNPATDQLLRRVAGVCMYDRHYPQNYRGNTSTATSVWK